VRRFLLTICLCLAAPVAFGEDAVVEPIENAAPLVLAAHSRSEAEVLKLLSTQPTPEVNQRTKDGTTALHWAVYRNEAGLVDRLLALHADANAKNSFGSTPMSEAAVVGNIDVLKKLLDAGANVESANADGQTALMIISRTSNLEAAKLLINHGANVNARERWREQSPLMWACAENQPAMVKLLLSHGA